MDTQITVRLPQDLAAAIEESARRAGLKRADIVRAALRDYLGASRNGLTDRPIDLVRDLLGKFDAGSMSGVRGSRGALLARIRRHAVRPA